MKFKDIEAAEILTTSKGKICIEQYSSIHGEPVQIFLTLDQFRNIENWIFKNKDEIELLWNEGIENE